ncbi:MAG: ribulose-phosphate 3-epimerase [Deltaproteobacteria bacterium RIFCSPLOWO2_12_FULL_50_11]|nr:MAG: ribulose-phosphate 3-epimerase [Deltaproteobacteria bacterium RIFCSPLOWO2_12_FULL_50_11]
MIAPSILSADFTRLGDEIRAVEAAGADMIHVDVMDGHFVPNLTVGPMIVEAVQRATRLPQDVHLMIENPEASIPEYIKAGAHWVSVHAEACPHLQRTLNLIRDLGAQSGVAINPATPLESIHPVLEDCDLVVIMTVHPGFGGQPFISQALNKVRELALLVQKRKLSLEIEVDGGVKIDNIKEVAEAGTTIFVSGSGIFKTKNYAATIQEMKKRLSF